MAGPFFVEEFDMKKAMVGLVATVIVIASVLLAGASSHDWSDWEQIAVVQSRSGHEAVVLAWRHDDKQAGHTINIEWRVSSIHSGALYEVELGDRAYTCSDGSTVTRPSTPYDGQQIPTGGTLIIADVLSRETCPNITAVEFTGDRILTTNRGSVGAGE